MPPKTTKPQQYPSDLFPLDVDPKDITPPEEVIPIYVREEAIRAAAEQGVVRFALLPISAREPYARYLIDRCEQLNCHPNPVWNKVLTDPEYFVELRKQIEDGSYNDGLIQPDAEEMAMAEDVGALNNEEGLV